MALTCNFIKDELSWPKKVESLAQSLHNLLAEAIFPIYVLLPIVSFSLILHEKLIKLYFGFMSSNWSTQHLGVHENNSRSNYKDIRVLRDSISRSLHSAVLFLTFIFLRMYLLLKSLISFLISTFIIDYLSFYKRKVSFLPFLIL